MDLSGLTTKPAHYFVDNFTAASLTRTFNLTFPQNAHAPTKFLQFGKIPLIPDNIPFDFLAPEIRTSLGPFEQTTIVTMPETAVDQDHRTIFRQNNIGGSRKILSMQPEPVAARVESLTNQNFRLRILASNARHHSGTGLPVYDVDHLTNAFWNLERYLVSYSLT